VSKTPVVSRHNISLIEISKNSKRETASPNVPIEGIDRAVNILESATLSECKRARTIPHALPEDWSPGPEGFAYAIELNLSQVSVVECFETVERVNDWRVRVRLG
jgi:hypothetical protein